MARQSILYAISGRCIERHSNPCDIAMTHRGNLFMDIDRINIIQGPPRRPFCEDFFISGIPGDPVDANILYTAYHILMCIHPMRYIHNFIRTGRFVKSALTMAVESIPRWSLSMCIESEIGPGDSDGNVPGFNHALDRCCYWRRRILSGSGDPCAYYVLRGSHWRCGLLPLGLCAERSRTSS